MLTTLAGIKISETPQGFGHGAHRMSLCHLSTYAHSQWSSSIFSDSMTDLQIMPRIKLFSSWGCHVLSRTTLQGPEDKFIFLIPL